MDVEDLLLASGFENIVVMSSCPDAEEWLRRDAPNVAILDISLRDGLSTGVAQTLVDRNVPFVVHTGTEPSRVIAKPVFLSGIWVAKPGQRDELRDAVQRLLGQED